MLTSHDRIRNGGEVGSVRSNGKSAMEMGGGGLSPTSVFQASAKNALLIN
jgi:hypothetical protein